MFKILALLFFALTMLFPKSIHFSEEKYYDALGKTFSRQGEITFQKKGNIHIVYEKNQGTVTYTEDFLYIEKKGKTKKLDLSENPGIKMFFILFEAIHLNQTAQLKSYFDKSAKKGFIELKPKAKTRKHISRVRYKRVNNRLKLLEIYLTNKDRVRIETAD